MCEEILFSYPSFYSAETTATQAVIDAISADTNPQALTPLKGIDSLTVDSPVLTLPANRTVIRAKTHNYGSQSIFTWRKIHGPGEVTFAPCASPDDGSRTVIFDGVPGEYLFEFKLSDSRNLTEVKQTVAIRLEKIGGGLPANSPPVANAQNLSVNQAVALPVILTGSDPEGRDLNYAITSEPGHGYLSGTPPLMEYKSKSGYLGSDSFDFQVMDSEGQVSTATITINVNNSSPVGLAIYEPFNYTAGTDLNGKSGGGDVGFAGAWASSTSTVQAGSLGDGDILTKGGRIGNSKPKADRAISTAALAARGLLNHGATLWFSGYFGPDVGANVTNGRFAFALANKAFPTGTSQELWIPNEGSQLGSGIGFTIVSSWSAAAFQTAEFRDQSYGTGVNGYLAGSFERDESLTGHFLKPGEYSFVVGKITWGIDADHVDRIEIYQPRFPNVLPENPCSVLETNVDQSTFDTLTIRAYQNYSFDEIRFGENLNSVLAGSVNMTNDVTAPTPNPIAFYKAPHVSGISSISMTAMPASDANGVEYYFTCTAGGGHDSGWRSSRDYTDVGLTPGVTYSYTVKTRDLSVAKNTSSASAAASATIPATWVAQDLVGLSSVSAEYLITQAGLTVGTITYANDTGVPAGSVISQSLGAGSSAALGSAVDLVISLGPPLTTVPNVVGLAQATAQSNIVAANLAAGTVTQQYSFTVPAGCVISQGPAAGSSAPIGSAVDLVVSLGPPPTTVPNVVGLTVATAQSNLAAASLAVGTISQQYSATVPAGSVISQGLAAGSSVTQGTVVNLVVSLGTPYYWDSNGTTNDFGSTSGTWGSSAFWSTSSAGTGATANTTMDATNHINFGTSSNGYAGTVTLNGDKTANSLTFGGGAGAGAIGFVSDSTTARKLTPGAGGITMNAGSGAVTFGNGTTTVRDVLLTLPTTSSQTTQVWTNHSANDFTINTSAALARSAGNALTFVKTGTGNFSIGTTLLPNNASTGIIGTWAFFGTGANTKYAYNNAGTIAALTGTGASTGANLTDTTGFVNYDLAGATGTVPATVSANTIRYTGSGGTTAPGATSFTVNGLVNAGSGLWTIGTNKLTIGSDKELVINAASGDITISGIISNNSGGTSVLTKLGTGTLTLAGDNNFSGVIRILDGVVKAGKNSTSSSVGPFGSGVSSQIYIADKATAGLDINGFDVFVKDFSGGGSNGGNVTLTTGNTLTINSVTNGGYNGIISGGGNLTLNGSSGNSLNNANTYTGVTKIGSGNATVNVSILADGGIPSGIGAATSDASNLVFLGASNATPRINYNSSASASTNRQFTLSGNAGFYVGGAGAITWSNMAAVTHGTVAARTVAFGGSGAGLGTMAAAITDSGTGSNITAVNKNDTGTWKLTSANSTFTGAITLNTTTASAGTLAYASAGGSNPIVFKQTTSTAILSYIGNSDRTMSGAITDADLISGIITLDSSGLGAVNYSNTGSLGNSAASGAKGLVLSGTNTGNNILAGKWEDNTAGGAATLTKNGAGTWILSGANSHTGPTAITAGKLFINGDQSPATGNVTVSSGATLGGTGVIGGNTTIDSGGKLEFDLSRPAASHDPLNFAAGRDFAFSGTSTLTITTSGGAAPGIYTLVTGDKNITGSAPATLKLPAGWSATVSISGKSLLLNVASTGTDITPPTVVSITDDTGGTSVVVNTTVNYTVTFSEDMNYSTVSAADFGNAGTAFCDIGTVTETSSGVFLVPVTPTSAGSLRLGINAGADFQDLAGNSLNTASSILDDTIITVTPAITGTPYSDWAATNAPTGTSTDDDDGDGVPNAIEFILGGTNSTKDLDKLPAVNMDGDNAIFSFKRSQGSISASTVVTIQVFNDLAGEPDVYLVPDQQSAGPPLAVVKGASPGFDTITLTLPMSGNAKRFVRLAATVIE